MHSIYYHSFDPMENNNQKQQPDDSDSNKKESTNSGGNDDTPSTSSSQRKDIIHEDVCSICLGDVSMLDIKTFVRYTCCGKAMHRECNWQLAGAEGLSAETRNSCPMCRAASTIVERLQIERLQRWSQRNRSWAQFGLSGLYLRGRGVNKDPKRAFELIKLAADQGHHHAQCNLGIMYQEGRGVIQSDTLAFKYYKLSADQGHAIAQYGVGKGYADGTGVIQSDTLAFKYYKLSAEQGYAEAQSLIASMKEEVEVEEDMRRLLKRGAMLFSEDKPNQAKPLFEEVVRIAHDLGDVANEARAVGNLASVFEATGQHHRAIELYMQCISILRTVGDSRNEARIVYNVSQSYMSLERYDEAIDYLNQSLALTVDAATREAAEKQLQVVRLATRMIHVEAAAEEAAAEAEALAQREAKITNIEILYVYVICVCMLYIIYLC